MKIKKKLALVLSTFCFGSIFAFNNNVHAVDTKDLISYLQSISFSINSSSVKRFSTNEINQINAFLSKSGVNLDSKKIEAMIIAISNVQCIMNIHADESLSEINENAIAKHRMDIVVENLRKSFPELRVSLKSTLSGTVELGNSKLSFSNLNILSQ